MKILADRYLHHLEELLPADSELTTYDPDQGFPAHCTDFDALLIRTVTKINQDTLPEAGHLKFIGTATAGFDHVDLHHLNELGIRFTRSAGCNARAVAEYVLTTLFYWCDVRGMGPNQLTVGVVGAGQTGSALIRLLDLFGIQHRAYDPPKSNSEKGFTSCSEEDLLKCDLLSFHTPLTHDGDHPTYHLCSEKWLQKGFRLIINAARGGVVDEKALIKALGNGEVEDAILDVWEHEPLFSDEMAEASYIATPHIAGYSSQAKVRASRMVVEQLCDFFDLPLNPAAGSIEFTPPEPNYSERDNLPRFLWSSNQIKLYHQEMMMLIGLPNSIKGERFSKLRAKTPTRHEYATIIKAASLPGQIPQKANLFLEEDS
ncbi:MAG: 4-phosphoerythronate dehydrogenase [Balneolaceae bacterium]|nr:4-phosphoerythronate dehydrogenase [Balneolaceae bacterium]MCH8548032.1 4-phosphoerythronate dehydrogenase [Balneolaceae bacterium]